MGIVIDVLSVSDFFVVGVVMEAVMGTKKHVKSSLVILSDFFFKVGKMLLGR